MGKLDDQFMASLVKARELLPQVQRHLNEPGYIPEDLDKPQDQDEIDNLFMFGSELVKLTSQLNSLAIKLCMGMSVQEIYDLEENEEEEEEGMTLDEKYRDLGLRRDMF